MDSARNIDKVGLSRQVVAYQLKQLKKTADKGADDVFTKLPTLGREATSQRVVLLAMGGRQYSSRTR